ncbi:MAG: VanZ family protein [Bacteroidales bacterium]|nr:VanZ family protein [Bacteroidales bacterium]
MSAFKVRPSASVVLHAPPYIFTAMVVIAICYLTLMPDPLPDADLPLFPGVDKVVHFLMFGGLAVIMCFDYGRRRGHCHSIKLSLGVTLLMALISSVAGGVVEVLQGIMGLGRSADWLDLLADTLGAFVCALTFYFIVKRYPTLFHH